MARGHYRQNHRRLYRPIDQTAKALHRVYLELNHHRYQVRSVIIQGLYRQNRTKSWQDYHSSQAVLVPLQIPLQIIYHMDAIPLLISW